MSDPAFARLYEPLDVPKPVARDVWVVDGPVIRMAFPLGLAVPFPTRMTVVRLPDGALWLHSPLRHTEALGAAVAALGPVRHLVSPNFIHYAGIPGWAAAFSEAKAWASPGVRERAASQGIAVRFDGELTDSSEAAWASVIEQHVFKGSDVMREVVFFHRPSRTLLLADLIENFELDMVRPPWRWLLRLAGVEDPDGKAPLDMRLTFRRRDEARASLARLVAWEPERIILGHGRWYPTGGAAELRRAFRWLGAGG